MCCDRGLDAPPERRPWATREGLDVGAVDDAGLEEWARVWEWDSTQQRMRERHAVAEETTREWLRP